MNTHRPNLLRKRLLVGLIFMGVILQSINIPNALGAEPAVVTVDLPAISPTYNGMCDSGWHQIENEFGDFAYLALNTNDLASSIHSGEWHPDFSQDGYYLVEAFIPSHAEIDWECPDALIPGDTTQAQYTIYHALGQSAVTVDQSSLSGEWFELGEYPFKAGGPGYVSLTDLNEEANQSHTVSFSAVRFTWVAPAPTIIYIPVLNAGPRIKLTSIWTADGEGNPRTAFISGETIRFYAAGLNITGKEVTANLSWSHNGPCGTSSLSNGNLTLAVENWTEYESILAPACSGIYVYTFQILYQGQTEELSSLFVVNKPSSILEPNSIIEKGIPAFDRCNIPTIGQLQTWWSESPYYTVNMYIGGISRACLNAGLDAVWVHMASQQGWSFIPTWVGPQAPCSVLKNRMSWDPAIAYSQGRSEADAAAQASLQLGFTNDQIIYYDMEGYNYSSGATLLACRNTVKSFINGWVERLHELGVKAGVYGGSCSSYVQDWASIESPPDAVWYARWKYSSFYAGAQITTDSCLPDELWANHQRIWQYAGDHTENWGGVAMTIDSNLADGPVTALAPIDPLSLSQAAPPQEDQETPEVQAAQLLPSGQGWSLVDGRLFWSQDGGKNWADITPSEAASAPLLSVYFQDESHGWLVVREEAAGSLTILATADGGDSWRSFILSDVSDLVSSVTSASLEFIDPTTGWVSLKLLSGSNFSRGVLFRTGDAGRTWEQLPLPLGEPVRFIDENRGWVAGGAAGNELFATVDGGRNWQPQPVITVEENLPGQVFVGLPSFESGASGLLPVTFADPANPRVEVYSTQDGGNSWEFAYQLPLSPESPPARSAVLDLTAQGAGFIAPDAAGQLLSLDTAGAQEGEQTQTGLPGRVAWLEFVNPTLGWVQVQDGVCSGYKARPGETFPENQDPFQCTSHSRLMQTTDGGNTWEEITP